MKAIYTITSALALVATVVVAASGGHGDAPVTGSQALAATVVEPTLLDDEGRPTLSQPAPVSADPGSRQTGVRLASARQAASLEQALGARVLAVQVRCCGADATKEAELEAYGQQVARALPSDTPVLIRGADPKMAAEVGERLSVNGFNRVWMVVQ